MSKDKDTIDDIIIIINATRPTKEDDGMTYPMNIAYDDILSRMEEYIKGYWDYQLDILKKMKVGVVC